MKIVTQAQLQSLLSTYSGFISMVTGTTPKMNLKHRETKAPNPFMDAKVLRTATRLGLVGASYEIAVNNRREEEHHALAGEFKAESLWNGKGEHISKSLCRHTETGKVYAVFYPRRENAVLEDAWTVNGEKVEEEVLSPYLCPVSNGSKRQETKTPVAWRTIALESIISVTLRGETFVVAH